MTLLDIRQAANSLRSLEESKRKSAQLYGRTEEIRCLLGFVSEMQQVQRNLKYVLEDMQEEYQLMNQFSACLKETCKSYIQYENEITEFTEEILQTRDNQWLFGEITIPEIYFKLLR